MDRGLIAPYWVVPIANRWKPTQYETLRGAACAIVRLMERRLVPHNIFDNRGELLARSAVYSNGTTYVQFRKELHNGKQEEGIESREAEWLEAQWQQVQAHREAEQGQGQGEGHAIGSAA